MPIRVQIEDFEVGAEIVALRKANPTVGAVVSFIGQVRDVNEGDSVHQLTLEHYPGMTEKALADIAQQASERWRVIDSLIIHRVGTLQPLDQIVLVAVSSEHREDAFKACEFIMDFLKTKAPFWKKEITPDGERWVNAKLSDEAAQARWK